jgi:DNA polymerase-3 subunit epsilon
MTNSDILETNLKDITFSVVDVETTGLRPTSSRVIEIGIVKVRDSVIVDRYSTFINPGTRIPPFISSLTTITDEDVYDAPFFEDAAQEIIDVLSDTILVGHNLQFDFSFLKHEFQRAGKDEFNPLKICTLKIARKLYPELPSKSLGKVARHLHIRPRTLHRALDDAELTAYVLMKEIKELESAKKLSLRELMDYQLTPGVKVSTPGINNSIAEQLSEVPGLPGNYFFLNAKNEIIYIGKAKSLNARLKSYFYGNASGKGKKIVRQASKVQFQTTGSELTALLSEAELIKLVYPKHNVQLKDFTNKYFLRINRAQHFPSIEVTTEFDFDGNDYFGLFTTRRKAAEVQDFIDKAFLTRECDEKEFKKSKRCFLAEIERCTAPCENKDSVLYESELQGLYEFMYGKNQFILNRLLERMKHYSEQMRYEKAGEVKALVDLVIAQIQKSALLSEPVNKANVLLKVSGSPFTTDYLIILEGKVYIKDYYLSEKTDFLSVLDDYYSETITTNNSPQEEDLEKLKIILNWIVRNRNSVQIYYLKDYKSKDELFKDISSSLIHQEFISKTREILLPKQ